jgi:hypothetical protein
MSEGAEERARRMGWVPKEEFKGDPEVWRDADEFVKRGEEMLGIAKERNRALDTRIQELEKTIKQFTEFHKKTEERAYERAKREYAEELRRIQDEMDSAVKDGDARKVRELVKERDELAPPEKEVTPAEQAPPTAFLEWHRENSWYTTQGHETAKGDKRLSKYADKIALFLLEDPEFKYTPDDVEFYDAVRQEVESRFPEHFENPRQGEQRVEGTSTPRRRKSGKRTASDLPAEARAEMKRFIKEGLISEDEFLKEYEWDEE